MVGNEKKSRALAQLEVRVKEMEELIVAKDKELREVKAKLASLPVSGSGNEGKTAESAPASADDP